MGSAGIGLGGKPAFKLPAREEPFATKLCGGQPLRPRKLIERAFRQAEKARGFLKRQDIRHLLAKFGKKWQAVKRNGELTRCSPIRI